MRQSGEPSVEEILESIKKVIARDNRSASDDERRARETQGVARIAEAESGTDAEADHLDPGVEEVLELGESVEFAKDHGETGGFDDMAFEEDRFDDVHRAAAETGPLVTEDARISMRDSLAALAVMAQPGAAPQIVRSGETSLEGMARDLLRPALATWLDTNLPPLVERLVAAEIARIVGKKG